MARRKKVAVVDGVKKLSPLEALPDVVLVDFILSQLPVVELLRAERVSRRMADAVGQSFRRKLHLNEADSVGELFDKLYADCTIRSWRANAARKKLVAGLFALLRRCPQLKTFDFSYKFFVNQGHDHAVGVKLADACPNLTEVKITAFDPKHCRVAFAYGRALGGRSKVTTLSFLDNYLDTAVIRQHVAANVKRIVKDFPCLEEIRVGSLFANGDFADCENLIRTFLETSTAIKRVAIFRDNAMLMKEQQSPLLDKWLVLETEHQEPFSWTNFTVRRDIAIN